MSVDMPTALFEAAPVAPAVRPVADRAQPSNAADVSAPLRAVPPLPPYGRRGAAWAVVTAGAVAAGPWALAVWLCVGTFLVVDRVTRRWRAAGVRRLWIGGTLLALVSPLAAATGRSGFAVMTLLVVVTAVMPVRARVVRTMRAARAGQVAPAPGRAAVALTGLAASLALVSGSLVLIERDSVASVSVLLVLVCCYDASRYLVGTGAPAAWEGAAAGVAAVGSAALCVAVMQPSPVTGVYPWVLGLVVVVAGLTGRRLAALWTPTPRRANPSRPGPMARLATLAVAAPLWLLVSALGHF